MPNTDDTRDRANSQDSDAPPPDDNTAKKRTRGPKKPRPAKEKPEKPIVGDVIIDDSKHDFFITYNVTMDEFGAHLGVYGWAVYTYLIRHSSQTGTTIPRSKRRIAETFGISPRKVEYELRKLEELGLITTNFRRTSDVGRPDMPSTFRIVNMNGYAQHAHPPTHSMRTPPHDMRTPPHDMRTPTHGMRTDQDVVSKPRFDTNIQEGSQGMQNEEGDEVTNAPPPVAPPPPSGSSPMSHPANVCAAHGVADCLACALARPKKPPTQGWKRGR